MRFLLLVAVVCLLAASLYLAAIFGPAPYAAVARLGHLAYFEDVTDGLLHLKLALTPARYAAFRTGLWGLLGGSLLAAAGLLPLAKSRRQLRRLGQEARRAGAALRRTVRNLSGPERAVAGGLLLAILGVRLVWFFVDPPSPDEMASYDYFVREGPVSITSFYPIPNNHVFYNFCSWVVAQLAPGAPVWLVIRLPSLLVATAGTALSYALLAHFRNFRVATVVTALFDLTRLTIIYAASGRGYYVQMVCIELAFFAAVELAAGGRCRRLAWAVFVGSSIVGLYTVPTYALPLASLGLVLLGAGWGRRPRQRRRYWGQVFLAGAIIGATTAVLYAPVGAVSGWPRLLANRYVAPHSLAVAWALGRTYLYTTADALLGSVRPGLVGGALLLALAPLVLRRAKGISGRSRWLVWACWALLAVPPVQMLVQQVFVPARALMYATYSLYLLAALGADYALVRGRRPWAARLPAALLGALLLFRVGELGTQVPAVFRSRAQDAAVARAYRWLRAQPPGPVFLCAMYHEVMFFHYALLDGHPLTLDVWRAPGARYPYLVWAKGQAAPAPAWAQALPYRVAYEDAVTIIYTLDAPASSR